MEDKYRSLEIPVFETTSRRTAEFLITRAFTFLGVEPRSEHAEKNAWTFKFGVQRGGEPAKTAAAFENGTFAEPNSKAIEYASGRIQEATLDFQHRRAITED